MQSIRSPMGEALGLGLVYAVVLYFEGINWVLLFCSPFLSVLFDLIALKLKSLVDYCARFWVLFGTEICLRRYAYGREWVWYLRCWLVSHMSSSSDYI
jgi:hypothetical protein